MPVRDSTGLPKDKPEDAPTQTTVLGGQKIGAESNRPDPKFGTSKTKSSNAEKPPKES